MNASEELDDTVRQQYNRQPRSVDEILCDPELATEFAQTVVSEIGVRYPPPDILRRLITLRKRGAERGGLPK